MESKPMETKKGKEEIKSKKTSLCECWCRCFARKENKLSTIKNIYGDEQVVDFAIEHMTGVERKITGIDPSLIESYIEENDCSYRETLINTSSDTTPHQTPQLTPNETPVNSLIMKKFVL